MIAPTERPRWADAECPHCSGSGFSVVLDDECPCVERSISYAAAPDRIVVALSERQKVRLERALRRILISARRIDAVYLAATIARAVEGGALPPSVEKLAAFAKVDTTAADEMMTEIRAAVARSQTKKKGKTQ